MGRSFVSAPNLLIYCSGGFGREVLDIARRINLAQPVWERIAFIDDTRQEPTYCGADVFRLDAALAFFGPADIAAVIASGEPFVRKALLEKLDARKIRLATLIDPSAVVSESATIRSGCIISPFCFVSSMATVGSNVGILAASSVGHDAVIGDNCVVSGQVSIGAGCLLGSDAFIGMGSQLKQGTSIGAGAIVGMGSVVFSGIPEETIALGNPCRPMRPNISKRIFG